MEILSFKNVSMIEKKYRIVELPDMRVAVFNAVGESPEIDSWNKLHAWAEPLGLLEPGSSNRLFGYNNPNPTKGDPVYGYDSLVTVDPDFEMPEGEKPDGFVEIRTLKGNKYAVLGVTGVPNITNAWIKLYELCKANGIEFTKSQWLEEHISPLDSDLDAVRLDLYAPLGE